MHSSARAPRLTIAIPTFNRSGLLRARLEKLLALETDFDIVVSDDCSVDETRAVLDTFRHPRLHINVNTKNQGLFENFNTCLGMTQTEFVLFLCDDDDIDEELIPVLYSMVKERDIAAAVTACRYSLQEADGTFIAREVTSRLPSGLYEGDLLLSLFTEESTFQLCSVAFNTGRLKRIGGFPLNHRYAGDLLTYGKIFIGNEVAFEQRPLATYMSHYGNETTRLGITYRLRDLARVYKELRALSQNLPADRRIHLSASMDLSLTNELLRQTRRYLKDGASKAKALRVIATIFPLLKSQGQWRILREFGFDMLPLKFKEAIWTAKRLLSKMNPRRFDSGST